MGLVQSAITLNGSEVSSLIVGGAAWSSDNTLNNLLVVGATVWDSVLWTLDAADCTDNKVGGSNTYTLDALNHYNYSGTEMQAVGIWSTINQSASGKLAITVTFDQTCVPSIWAAEFSGYLTSGYIGNTGTNQNTTGDANVTVNIGTAGSMMVALFGDIQSINSAISPAATWSTIQENEDGSPENYYNRFSSVYKESLPTGNATHTWSVTDDGTWAACAVEYKAAVPAIAYYGFASTPADDGTNSTDPTAVTPPESMTAGMLAILVAMERATDGGGSLAISNSGGQTWTSLGTVGATNIGVRAWMCEFNGTWSANPSVDFAGTTHNSVYLIVFSPSDAAKTWAVDVSLAERDFASPSSPYNVSLAEITTLVNNALVLAGWFTPDDDTWALQTSGWANPTGVAQIRNNAGQDGSASFAFKVQATAGGTGAVVNQEGDVAPDAGTGFLISFKETSPVINFSMAINGVTVAAAIDGNISRSLASAINGIVAAGATDLNIQRPMSLVANGQSAVANIDLSILVSFASVISAVVATNQPALNIARNLVAAINGVLTAGTPGLNIQRPLASAINTQSATAAIDLSNLVSFASAISAVIASSQPALNVSRPLVATIGGISSTPDLSLPISRALNSAMATIVDTAIADLNILRPLSLQINGQSATSSIDLTIENLILFSTMIAAVISAATADLSVARNLSSSIAAASAASNPAASINRPLGASVAAISSSALADLQVQRALAAFMAGTAALDDSELKIERPLISSMNGISSVSSPAVLIQRLLSASMNGQTSLSDIDLTIQGMILFSMLIDAVSSLSAAQANIQRPISSQIGALSSLPNPDLSVLRPLSSAAQGISNLPSADLIVGRNLSAQMQAISQGNSSQMQVLRNLLCSAAGQANLSMPSLQIERILQAILSGQSQLSAIDLILLALGIIIDPEILSITASRVWDSKSAERGVESRTIHRSISNK